MFLGSSTMKTCLMLGSKSNPLERREVVNRTWGVDEGSESMYGFFNGLVLSATAVPLPPGPSDVSEVRLPALIGLKNPSRYLLLPRVLTPPSLPSSERFASRPLVTATFLIPFSSR